MIGSRDPSESDEGLVDIDAEGDLEDELGSKGKSRTRSIVVSVLSVLLLVGAGYFVYDATGGLGEVWSSIKSAPWWMLVLMVLGPIGNHLSVAMCLHALQSRHGKLGRREMIIVVGSAWMFNYLPMRAGLVGRIGYHKSVNKIRVRDSLESSVWSGVLAGIANLMLVGVAIVMMWWGSAWGLGLVGMLVALIFLVSVLIKNRWWKLLVIAMGYRQIDVAVWLGRYWVAFEVLGLEMGIGEIAMVSAASQLASLMPLTGSGIGFREWVVGLTASAGGHAMKIAIAADLINRTLETLIVFPVGLACTAWTAKRWESVRKLEREERVAKGLAEDEASGDPNQEDTSGKGAHEDPSVG